MHDSYVYDDYSLTDSPSSSSDPNKTDIGTKYGPEYDYQPYAMGTLFQTCSKREKS